MRCVSGVGSFWKLGAIGVANCVCKSECAWQVDHPLCLECAMRVKEEIENTVKEVREECSAYEEAIARLEQENLEIMPEEVSATRSALMVVGEP